METSGSSLPRTDDQRRIIRVLAGVVGIAFGAIFVAIGLVVATSDAADAAVVEIGTTVLVLGGLLGFVFGPRAAKPDHGSALATSAAVTALAVPLGSVLAASLQFGRDPAVPWLEWAAGIGGIALLGLVFLGLPFAGLIFVVANLWVIVLRLVLRLLRVGVAPSD